MAAGESESPASRGGSSSPVSRSHRNGTKESSRSSKKQEQFRIVQVANIAPQATRDQMYTLFGFIGKIEDLRLYPTVDLGLHIPSKICFVKFADPVHIGIAQHLTNTVFIDRALIVLPFVENEIPDEQKGMELLNSGSLLPGIADPKLPQHVTSQIEGMPPSQVVVTVDPKLSELELPPYPSLPPTHDARKIEEIRRTILVANVDPEVKADEFMDHFSAAGEVKYFRFCTRDNDPLHYALVEYTEQPSILEAFKLNGTMLGSKNIKVYHSTQAIIKPQAKTNEAAQKEIEEAMSRQAQSIMTQGIEVPTAKDKRTSRTPRRSRSPRIRRKSRSRSRKRSRSRSANRYSRSGSRSYRRSPSRSQRSSSRHRQAYRSGRKRSRTRSPKRSRSRSRDKRSHRSKKRSRSRDRHRRRSRSRSSTKRSRSRSRKREEKKKSKKSKKDRDRSKERPKDKEKDRDREKQLDEAGKSDRLKTVPEDGENSRAAASEVEDMEVDEPYERPKKDRDVDVDQNGITA